MEKKPLIVEALYNAPREKVWSALTNNDEIKKWYFQFQDFKPKVGFKFDFISGPEDGPKYLHLCQITQLEEGTKLAYTWKYDNYEGNSEIIWELFDAGDKTRLTLTHIGLDSFEPNGTNFRRDSFKGGWNYFLNEALKNHLEPSE